MVSRWVKESIRLAMDPREKYLDRLLRVYPAASAEREITLTEKEKKKNRRTL